MFSLRFPPSATISVLLPSPADLALLLSTLDDELILGAVEGLAAQNSGLKRKFETWSSSLRKLKLSSSCTPGSDEILPADLALEPHLKTEVSTYQPFEDVTVPG